MTNLNIGAALGKEMNKLLTRVEKPARYTGGEFNCTDKQFESAEVKVALAFPDIYEVGMSNLGLKILYSSLNNTSGVFADRVYAPAYDMEELMRAEDIPLFGLESQAKLKDFDIVGFSLAYEMSYTTVLNMLDLAQIPVFAKDRTSDDPVIIAGGHCAFNPEPMADFIDAFVIGDGEETLVDIVTICKDVSGRAQRLTALAEIDGVYVPTIHTNKKINIRVVPDLEKAHFPEKFVVPFIETVHNRAMVEVMRGCTRGCRFCQAGMITRPVRERSAELIEKQVKALLGNTGYDEVALTSLSSADYSPIKTVVANLLNEHRDKQVSVSLPSLRADADCVALAAEIQKVRKSGLTFAPEAGSKRLRDVINKNITEEDLLLATEAAIAHGWRRVKLYFMIGLPTETDEDLVAIGELVTKVISLGKKHHVPLVLNITISPFVPKPHTPFQWRKMVDACELERKISVVRSHLKGKNISLSWHDPNCSRIEAALARGDRKVSKAIYNSWKLGGCFEQDKFDKDRWERAFAEAGLEISDYANRDFAYDEELPWDFIIGGVSKEFLLRESMNADLEKATGDCRFDKCSNCGVRDNKNNATCPPKKQNATLSFKPIAAEYENNGRASVLFRLRKLDSARWIGHLDLIGILERAVRMADVRAAYTEGFNPRIKMSIASALPLGASSDAEIFTLVLEKPFEIESVTSRLNKFLPKGVELFDPQIRAEHAKAPVIEKSEYILDISAPDMDGLAETIDDFLSSNEMIYLRKSAKGAKNIDLRPGVEYIDILNISGGYATIAIGLKHLSFTVKPAEIIAVLAQKIDRLDIESIRRSKLCAKVV